MRPGEETAEGERCGDHGHQPRPPWRRPPCTPQTGRPPSAAVLAALCASAVCIFSAKLMFLLFLSMFTKNPVHSWTQYETGTAPWKHTTSRPAGGAAVTARLTHDMQTRSRGPGRKEQGEAGRARVGGEEGGGAGTDLAKKSGRAVVFPGNDAGTGRRECRPQEGL